MTLSPSFASIPDNKQEGFVKTSSAVLAVMMAATRWGGLDIKDFQEMNT